MQRFMCPCILQTLRHTHVANVMHRPDDSALDGRAAQTHAWMDIALEICNSIVHRVYRNCERRFFFSYFIFQTKKTWKLGFSKWLTPCPPVHSVHHQHTHVRHNIAMAGKSRWIYHFFLPKQTCTSLLWISLANCRQHVCHGLKTWKQHLLLLL